MGMMPLLDRGREALRAYTNAQPFADDIRRKMVLSALDTIHVVTHQDFVESAALVLRHVVKNGTPTHILLENGSLVAVVERRIGTW